MNNKPYIEINRRKVGADYKPLVIAELGINHEGSLQTAMEMVDAAARAGVEVLKHQTHIVEDEMSSEAQKVIPGNADVSIYEIMARCALCEEDEIRLKEYTESKGIIFISTPFSRAAADRLYRMNVPAFKIGSGECNNYPLLEHIAQMGKPVIMSTGMNNIESIRKSLAIFDRYKVPVAILHTTNLYPTPPELVRLGAMKEMASVFPDRVFGLSDHTTSNLACLAAVVMGASILERHFTDRMDRQGPDIICSMDEETTRHLIADSRTVYSMLGGTKEAAREEQVTIDFAYASVVSIKGIKKGETFSRENIWVKRPGKDGIPAEEYEAILGKTAASDIDDNIQIKRNMIK
jgi:N-acetylneuraminate synthase